MRGNVQARFGGGARVPTGSPALPYKRARRSQQKHNGRVTHAGKQKVTRPRFNPSSRGIEQ